MTVPNTPNYVIHLGNGVTDEFPFTFKVFEAEDLTVTLLDATTLETVEVVDPGDYTVTGLGDDDGGSVTYIAIPASQKILIQRIVEYTQDADLLNQGGFYPETLEKQLDKQVMMLQQVADLAGRALVVPFGEDGLMLPVAADRENKLLGFDADGSPVAFDADSFEVTLEVRMLAEQVAEDAEQTAADAAQTATDREQTGEDAEATALDRLAAEEAADDAQDYAGIAATAGDPIYPDEATGRAAVADGEYFKVAGDGTNTFVELYRRVDAGTSTLIAGVVSDTAFNAGLAQLGNAAGLLKASTLMHFGDSVRDKRVRGWTSDAGRWRREAAGWVMNLVDNAERPYYDSAGVLRGLLIEGAETFYSAPFHEAVAGSGDAAYLSKSVAGYTVAQATTHATPDIFGGTGGNVLVTQNATTNGVVWPNNVTVTADSGDIVRFEALVHCEDAAAGTPKVSLQGRNISGTIPNGRIELTFNSAGVVTAGAGFNTLVRAGYDTMETLSGGDIVYLMWIEVIFTATGTVAASLVLNGANGWDLAVHDLRVIKNPTTKRAQAVPVLATAAAFAADKVLLASDQNYEATFRRLRCGSSRLTSGEIYPTSFRSGQALPYEQEIYIDVSQETANTNFIIPNPDQLLDFTPAPATSASHVTALGPGFYQLEVNLGAAGTVTNHTIKGAFSDPERRPWIDAWITPQSVQTNLIVQDLVIGRRTSTVVFQTEQSNLTATQFLRANSSLQFTDFMITGAPLTHARGGWSGIDLDVPGGTNLVGYAHLATGNGGTMDFTRGLFYHYGRAGLIDQGSAANTVTASFEGCHFDQIYSDGLVPNRGVIEVDFNLCLFTDFTAPVLNYWYSRREMEIDLGAGPVPFSTTGLTLIGGDSGYGTLPWTRKFSRIGYRETYDGPLVADPDPARSMYIVAWRNGWGGYNKDGYGGNLSMIPDERKQFPDDLEVFLSTGDGSPPSADNPWIYFTSEYGRWTNDVTWQSFTTESAGTFGTGTHPDAFQTNGGVSADVSLTATRCIIKGQCQGWFFQGTDPTSPNRDATITENIIAVPYQNAIYFSGGVAGGTRICEDNLLLALDTSYRYPDGFRPHPAFTLTGANTSATLTNNWVMGPEDWPMIVISGGGTNLGEAPNLIVGPDMDAWNYISVPDITPNIRQVINPGALTPEGYLADDVAVADWRFSDYAHMLTGIPLNEIVADVMAAIPQGTERLKQRVDRYHLYPDFRATVLPSAAVDTVIFPSVKGLTFDWRDEYGCWDGGNELGLFKIVDGAVKVASALTGLNRQYMLRSDADETFIINVQP